MQCYGRPQLPAETAVNVHAVESQPVVRSKWNFPQVITSSNSSNLPNFIDFRPIGVAPYIREIYRYNNAFFFILPLAHKPHQLTNFGLSDAFGIIIFPFYFGGLFPPFRKSISYELSQHKQKFFNFSTITNKKLTQKLLLITNMTLEPSNRLIGQQLFPV